MLWRPRCGPLVSGKEVLIEMTAVEKKTRVLRCIRQFLQENGYPPSIREICALSNIGALSTVNNYVDMLVREGRLKRNGSHRRCIVPVDFKPKLPTAETEDYHRVCLRTADGGALELDYSIVIGADHRPECMFNGILDCSRIKSPVSRIVGYRTDAEA